MKLSLLSKSIFFPLFFIVFLQGSIADTISFRGGKYSGEILRGLPDGEGTWVMDNGDVYSGKFVAGVLLDGNGRFHQGNGSIYEGSFLYSIPHGQGRLNLLNGSVYTVGYLENSKGISKLLIDLNTKYLPLSVR